MQHRFGTITTRTGNFSYYIWSDTWNDEILINQYNTNGNVENSISQGDITVEFNNNQIQLLGKAKCNLVGQSKNSSVNISIGFSLGTVTYNGQTYQLKY